MRLNAKVIPGRGVGRELGFPTLNFAIPPNFQLKSGVYTCLIDFAGEKHTGVLFFGARRTFADTAALEVHVLDTVIAQTPREATITVEAKIRNIKKFTSREKLIAAIAKDCTKARAMLDQTAGDI